MIRLDVIQKLLDSCKLSLPGDGLIRYPNLFLLFYIFLLQSFILYLYSSHLNNNTESILNHILWQQIEFLQ